MGTLATALAGKKIPTPEERYWAEVEGDIENVNNVLKITQFGRGITSGWTRKKPPTPKRRSLLPDPLPCSPERDGVIEIKDELIIV